MSGYFCFPFFSLEAGTGFLQIVFVFGHSVGEGDSKMSVAVFNKFHRCGFFLGEPVWMLSGISSVSSLALVVTMKFSK